MGKIDPIEAVRRLWPSLDNDQRVESVRTLCADGYSGMSIAAGIGVSEDIIVMMRLRHNIVGPNGTREDARLSPERQALIASMTIQGLSDAAIAAELGLAQRATVARHRASYRLPSPRRDLGLDLSVVARIIEMQRSGATIKEAAAATGYHHSTISKFFARMDWTWGDHNHGRALRTRRVDRESFRAAVAAGMAPSEIARAFGIDRNSATRIAREMGLQPRSLLTSSAEHRLKIEPLAADGLSATQIARALSITDTVVRKICRRYNIKLRDGRSAT